MDKIPFDFSIQSIEKAIANNEKSLCAVKRDIALIMNNAEYTRKLHEMTYQLGRVLGELEYHKPKPPKRRSLLAEQKVLEKKIRRLKRLNIAQLFEAEWLISEDITNLKTELLELRALSGVVKMQRKFTVELMMPAQEIIEH